MDSAGVWNGQWPWPTRHGSNLISLKQRAIDSIEQGTSMVNS